MATTNLLHQKERQLELLMALDRARDAAEVNTDPNSMFRAIVQLLKKYFEADACAILLLEDGSESIESITYDGTTEDTAIALCRQAMRQEKPTAIVTPAWSHTLAMHIIQDENGALLGGLFLARNNNPFSEDDVELMEIAESQIDSAVLQARMVWNVIQRNLQLEAIYQIDRMRDDNPGEAELISGFTSILIDYFKAELCLIFLSHMDSGEMILRGMVDKENLPMDALDTIRQITGSIAIPQIIQTPQEINDLTLMAAPFIVSGINLGAVVVGRRPVFTAADHRLLFAMMSQMDSAIVHSRVIQQLYQRNKEIETIYRIDHIRDRENDFDSMLHSVLTELCHSVSSEMGYLMLYNEHEEQQLELKATTVDGLLTSPIYYQVIQRVSREALKKGEMVYSNKIDGAVRSIVAVPLILNSKIIGVFGTVNSNNPRGFNAEDRRMLMAITSQVDTAVFERLEQRRMRRVLSRSVDPKVLEEMLKRADDHLLTGERVVLSVLFADLRGSTEWAEHTEPEELVSTLNLFLGRMTDTIFKHGGTLDKFVGDEVIALFGTPVRMEDHALQAAKAALEMQVVHKALQADLETKGIKLPSLGIGISSGEVIAGEIGPPIRTDFTAMGRVMNLGARLCSIAKAGQICINQTAHQMIGTAAEVRPLEPTSLKGIGTVDAYELVALTE